MVEMARAVRIPGIGSEYNAFLSATIGAGANGTLLSVLSAMARMNLDPWQEAADLAALSAKAAAHRLASLIAVVPGGPSESGEPEAIAARLVKLLPSQARSILPPLPRQSGFADMRALAQSSVVRNVLFVAIALALAATWFVGHRAPSVTPPTTHGSEAAQSTSGPASGRRN